MLCQACYDRLSKQKGTLERAEKQYLYGDPKDMKDSQFSDNEDGYGSSGTALYAVTSRDMKDSQFSDNEDGYGSSHTESDRRGKRHAEANGMLENSRGKRHAA